MIVSPVREGHQKVRLLTRRELQILELACDGRLDEEIANQCAIAHKTVENHMSSVYRKLGAKNRTQAIVVALKRQLVRPQWLMEPSLQSPAD